MRTGQSHLISSEKSWMLGRAIAYKFGAAVLRFPALAVDYRYKCHTLTVLVVRIIRPFFLAIFSASVNGTAGRAGSTSKDKPQLNFPLTPGWDTHRLNTFLGFLLRLPLALALRAR